MFYRISKTFYLLFIFYLAWFQMVFYPINGAPIVLGVGMIGFLILHKFSTKQRISILISKPVSVWILFAIYSFFTGYIISNNKSLLISSVFMYIQTILMIIYIINISKNEKSNRFFIKSYAVLSFLYAITILFWGFKSSSGIITISQISNPNSDGMIMFYGIFCILFLLNTKNPFQFIVLNSVVGCLLYAIILTGSRKSFLAAIVFILLWISFVFKYKWKGSSMKMKMFLIFLVVAILCIAIYQLLPLFFDSTLFIRITEGYGYEGDVVRKLMYMEALQYFYLNPLVGIGFNQFRVLSPWQTYSHSTYAEVISTTGIIGTILYFIPYLIILYNLIILTHKQKQTYISEQAMSYIILFIVMLLLAIGVIYFYDIPSNIMFALMISYYYIEKSKLNLKNINNLRSRDR